MDDYGKKFLHKEGWYEYRDDNMTSEATIKSDITVIVTKNKIKNNFYNVVVVIYIEFSFSLYYYSSLISLDDPTIPTKKGVLFWREGKRCRSLSYGMRNIHIEHRGKNYRDFRINEITGTLLN